QPAHIDHQRATGLPQRASPDGGRDRRRRVTVGHAALLVDWSGHTPPQARRRWVEADVCHLYLPPVVGSTRWYYTVVRAMASAPHDAPVALVYTGDVRMYMPESLATVYRIASPFGLTSPIGIPPRFGAAFEVPVQVFGFAKLVQSLFAQLAS